MSLHLPGDVAELGIYRGNTSANLISYLELAGIDKTAHLFDSFEGLDRPGENDACADPDVIARMDPSRVLDGRSCKARRTEVEERLNGLTQFEIHEGYFEDQVFDTPLCWAYIDADLYQSTIDAITLVKDLMVPGGCMIFDDYGADPWWPGVRKAVDEAVDPKEFVIVRNDTHGIWQAAAWKKH